jgi:predicted short-subunit dehydrogenase-like oxidoreductase (DUF2520 family)
MTRARKPAPLRAVVIGLGKAGGALVASLTSLAAPSGKRARIAIVQKARRLPRTLRPCDVLFLAVPDDALAHVDQQLAVLLGKSAAPPPIVVHLSGAKGTEALARVGAHAIVGTFHPLASLDGKHAIPAGTLIAVAATRAQARVQLERLARAIGCVPAHVPSQQRARYHAGAVVSANLAVALLAKGVDLLVAAGVPRKLARVSLARLLQSQADNAIARELADALTGPIARGDAGTVARHLALLDGSDPELAAVYRALSRVLIDDVTRHDARTKAALRETLTPVMAPKPK